MESIKDAKDIHLIYDLTTLNKYELLKVAEFIKDGGAIDDGYGNPLVFPKEKKFIP